MRDSCDSGGDLVGLKEESLDTDGQKHASEAFTTQERHLQQIMEQEREDYKDSFEKLSEKIDAQEKLLNEVTDKFNNHDTNDKDGKIKLYKEVHEAMGELIRISYNYGRSIENNDTGSTIGSLSSYDTQYDEDCVKKYIKEV